MAAPFVCWPPPCPISTSGRGPEPSAGVQSTPGMSPMVNSCSRMPSATVSEVIRTAGSHQRSRWRRKSIIRVTSLETVIPADGPSAAASAVLAFAVG